MTKSELVEQRRREITLAAFKVFAERGYHDTGIADIARELGMGHGTFYRYFENKRDIIDNVVDMAVGRVAAVVAGENPTLSSTVVEYRAQVERIGQALFDLFMDEPQLAQIFYFESLAVDRALTEKILGLNELFGTVTELYLENGVKKGFLRANLNVPITARAIIGMILEGGLAVFRADDPQAVRDDWVTTVADLIFGGVQA